MHRLSGRLNNGRGAPDAAQESGPCRGGRSARLTERAPFGHMTALQQRLADRLGPLVLTSGRLLWLFWVGAH